LSIYPPPENAYRLENHPQPVGRVTRPGSTSMWSGVRLVNGYSPIRGAGVGMAWAFYTHGEIDLSMADYLVGYEAGPNGLLAQVGVDGVIVARQCPMILKPASEWTIIHKDVEGTVYQRVGPPLARLRPLLLPNEKSSETKVHVIEDSRQRIVADIDTWNGVESAQLIFSRPYFDGYVATLNGKNIAVNSYKALVPTVRLPAGTRGRLTMVYRPWWLVLGGVVAGMSLLIFGGGMWRAIRERRRGSSGQAALSS
ncbi:MAG: hypothetical protein H0X40_18890, partial [Chthoniobacterales bacterium]|nr:hypothetical protein [Chthoniobacterales bacterium]